MLGFKLAIVFSRDAPTHFGFLPLSLTPPSRSFRLGILCIHQLQCYFKKVLP